jgi:hypothetical protein
MIKGCQVGLKEELDVGPGRLGRPAVSQSLRLSPFRLFCLWGLVSVGLVFSAAGQFVSTNFDAAANYRASTRDTMFLVAAQAPSQSSPETQTFGNKPDGEVSERNVAPNQGIGVALICGFALFLWVQRFRNSWV